MGRAIADDLTVRGNEKLYERTVRRRVQHMIFEIPQGNAREYSLV
ncbi:hypothetical protein AB2B41_20335 [Marimonas sp. MJW-29]|uniref:Uncharacterized protein n=1 Tax=Sulfitobacter sediminis TaxID=3234186 RepID=A0ABV3RTH3_9RHOB